MSLADDMLNLRREIDSLHAARMALMHRMNRFRAELRKSTARSIAEMHKAFTKECARARTARHAFISHNQGIVEGMLGAFRTERFAAHRNFMGKRA